MIQARPPASERCYDERGGIRYAIPPYATMPYAAMRDMHRTTVSDGRSSLEQVA